MFSDAANLPLRQQKHQKHDQRLCCNASVRLVDKCVQPRNAMNQVDCYRSARTDTRRFVRRRRRTPNRITAFVRPIYTGRRSTTDHPQRHAGDRTTTVTRTAHAQRNAIIERRVGRCTSAAGCSSRGSSAPRMPLLGRIHRVIFTVAANFYRSTPDPYNTIILTPSVRLSYCC